MDEDTSGPSDAPSFWVAPPQPGVDAGNPFRATEILADPGVGVRAPRRRTAIVASVAALSVAAVAGGAFAAYNVLSGGGAQPEEVLPASTVAFVKIDLDPSAGQKLALLQLLQKFPNASGLKDSDKSFGDWLMRRLSESAGPNDVNYEQDIKPWLGQRFAAADVPDSTGKSGEALLVLQETDEKAAAAGLDKLKRSAGASSFDYAFSSGYVVVSSSGDGAHKAVEAAKTASLAGNEQFTNDVQALGSDEIVTAWADATKVGQQLKSALSAVGGRLGALGADGSASTKLLDQTYQGRYVLGLHATSDSVELRTLVRGGKSKPAGATVSSLGSVLPGAWAVLDVAGLDQSIDSAWATLSALPGLGSAITQAKGQYGIELPGDLKAVLGSELVVSAAGDLTSPEVVAAAKTTDGAKAQEVLDKLLSAAGVDPSVVAQRVDGNRLYVGSSARAVARAGTGTITTDPLFQQAVADPGTAQAIVFVDLSKVWKALGDGASLAGTTEEVKHVAAIGVSSVSGGGDTSVTIRVIFS